MADRLMTIAEKIAALPRLYTDSGRSHYSCLANLRTALLLLLDDVERDMRNDPAHIIGLDKYIEEKRP